MVNAVRRLRVARRFRSLRAERLEGRFAPAGDITTGLVHYWPFDETGGDTAHDVVGGSDGELLNWDTFDPKWVVQGRVGGALEFSQPANAVIASPDAMTGSYAVSFWLNVFDRSGTNPRIFQSRQGNEIVVNNDSSKSVGYYYSGTRVATADPGGPTFNTWEHYAINFNAAGQGVVYHNGVPVAVGGFADSASLPSWVFGHSSDMSNTTDSLHGLLDELRVYNRLLTDEDITALANQGRPEPTHQEPVHHWTFDETSGNTAHDVAGDADGILLNWNATEPKWVPGKFGGALAFSTADDAVITAPADVHAEWTVAFWVNVTGPGGTNPRIIGPQDGRELWAYLDLENNGGGGFMSHEIRTFETKPIPLNQWQHYAITYNADADTATIYHNGVKVASGAFYDNATLQAWVFGHNCDLANDTDSLNGLLDDLRVYDRQLSIAEIQQLATVGPVITKADAYTDLEDILLTIPVDQGVLVNDSDLDDNAPEAVLAIDAVHGSVEMAADGSFTYQPAKDYNGPDGFTYKLTDSQGNSVTQTVSLTVMPVNDPPSFMVGGDRFVNDLSGSRSIGHWAFDVSAGPADEAGQNLTFTCTADHPELLAVQPQVVLAFGTYGSLTYTLKPNKVGVVTVTIVLQDDGGTADGGSDTSPPQTFKINIAKANPWHNEVTPLDVDDDGSITASDVVSIINYINARGSGPVDVTKGMAAPYCDVTSDGQITAEDVITVINYINAHPADINISPVEFLTIDTTTQGNWIGKYGADGYLINSGPTNLPSYANISFSGEYDSAWAPSTDEERALQKPGASDRIATAWTGHNAASIPLNGFTVDLQFTDGKSHRVAIYTLDWDTSDRTQKIEVIDPSSKAVLDTQAPTPFHDGKYFVWQISGHVQIRFTNLANGLNAVASGVFFG